MNRHGKSVNPGDAGLWKILQIAEDLYEMTNNFYRKAIKRANKSPYKPIKGTTTIKMVFKA